MIKLMGAVLILLGCGGAGGLVVAAHRYQERSLEQLLRALDYMECELQYQMTPLPELCKNASQVCTGCVRNVLSQLSVELDAQMTPDATVCMHAAVANCTNIPLRLHKCFKWLGDSLGRFDLAGQLQGLVGVKRHAAFELEQVRQNQDVRLRSYQTLGLCAGAALVVLFL